jgi:DNA-directed RNA polymerase subunit RPC12/RpoP
MSKYKCTKCGAPTDNDQSFEVIPIGGKEPHRVEVHRCDKCDKRFHQELDWESEGETINENELTCPYCGYEYDTYDAYGFREGDTDEVECEACGRKFDLVVETRRVFSTKRSLCEMPDDYGEEDDDQ